MDWSITKQAGHKRVGNENYDLRHLRDTTFSFTIPATKRYSELNAEMLVQYSSHCISFGPAHGERFDFSVVGRDRLVVDDRGNERCFCPDRFAWSKHLPDIIRSLPTDRVCYFTGHENWLSIEILDPHGPPKIYEVFFNLTRQSGKFLRVYVESAYVRTGENTNRRPCHFRRESKIRGKVLLAKKLRNQPITRPRHR